MPCATIGAFGWEARNSFHTMAYLPGNSALSTMVSGTSSSLNSRPTRGNAPVDAVLPEGLVDEIRIAAHHVRPVDRALAEAELLDEEGKADGDLLAARPRRDVDRLAREAGNGIGRILRHARRGKLRGERERDTGESWHA